jgi:MvaI/BcnI restriction endonuclease family
MTPEPTGGYYRSAGIEAFIRKFGYPDMTGATDRGDRLNFGGVHKVGEYHHLTKLQVVLKGFDAVKGKITDATGGISLMNIEGEEAAVWGYAEIMAKWNRKHNKAVYIPSQCVQSPERKYWYGNLIRIGTGTDFLKYLQAMAEGKVYYDPGIKLENASTSPRTKQRSQFRIKSVNLPALYHSMDIVDLSGD